MEKSIVKRMIMMMAVIIVIGIGLLFAGTKVMFDNTQDDVRIAYGKTQYGMIDNIFEHEKEMLDKLIRDYAVWDDMYYAIENKAYKWSRENATAFLVEDSDGFVLDFIHVFGSENDYSESYGDDILGQIKVSHIYMDSISQNKVTTDYMLIDDQLYLVSMSPVTTNNKKMTNGYYIMGRLFTGPYIEALVASYANRDEFLHMDDHTYDKEMVLEVQYKLKNELDAPVNTYVFHYNIASYFRSFSKLLSHVVSVTLLIVICLLLVLHYNRKQFDVCLQATLDRVRILTSGDYSKQYNLYGYVESTYINDELNELARVLSKKDEQSKRYHLIAMGAIIDTIEEHSHYMNGHSNKVMEISKVIGRYLGIENLEFLQEAALLHDVGKIGLPSEILNKKGPLTAEEYKLVRSHAVRGEKILSSVPYLEEAAKVIRHHHERYDGGGYPDHLNGEQIDLVARIITLADSFEAMTSDRPYRDKFEFYQAVAIVKKEVGKQFDERVVNAFLEGLQEIKMIIFEIDEIHKI